MGCRDTEVRRQWVSKPGTPQSRLHGGCFPPLEGSALLRVLRGEGRETERRGRPHTEEDGDQKSGVLPTAKPVKAERHRERREGAGWRTPDQLRGAGSQEASTGTQGPPQL